MPDRTELRLESGRLIRLTSINQWETYSGLLEGIPHMEMNARTVARTVNDARERYHFEPHLIQPPETLIDICRDYPFGTPASIPSITCVGQFECFDTLRDEGKDGSTLPLVWFQADFAFPIAPEVMQSIMTLAWDELATDFHY